jgi:hypothetical protein
MGKKYHENNARADKKGEKERKDKGKEKISDKKTEQEQCFIKLWETWKKMQAIGDIISYFSPIILIVALKRAQKSDWGKIYDIFSPCVFIFSPLDHAIIVLLSETV